MEAPLFEDRLLKGWALTHANAVKALGILNDAYAENKNSPIVRLIRADTHIRAAMEARDANDMLTNAKTAINDASLAETLLEDHPGPKPKLLRAYLLAAHACGELENAQGRQEYLELAGEVFSALCSVNRSIENRASHM